MGSLGWGSWPFSGGGKQYKTQGGVSALGFFNKISTEISNIFGINEIKVFFIKMVQMAKIFINFKEKAS